MSDISSDDLRALLAHSANAFTTVEATYRSWRHHERLSAAFRAHTGKLRKQGASITTTSARRDGPPGPPEHDEILRVWRDGDRVRQEHESDDWRNGAYAVRRGSLWWSWNSHIGVLSNQHDARIGGNIGDELSVMLNPTPLLDTLDFAVTGRATVAGRTTFTTLATPHPTDPRTSHAFALHQLGSGADEYRLEVDLERGVVLEATARLAGQPFHRVTTAFIEFDHPVPEERFVFEPPPGDSKPTR